jgi:hypothetical protein
MKKKHNLERIVRFQPLSSRLQKGTAQQTCEKIRQSPGKCNIFFPLCGAAGEVRHRRKGFGKLPARSLVLVGLLIFSTL